MVGFHALGGENKAEILSLLIPQKLWNGFARLDEGEYMCKVLNVCNTLFYFVEGCTRQWVLCLACIRFYTTCKIGTHPTAAWNIFHFMYVVSHVAPIATRPSEPGTAYSSGLRMLEKQTVYAQIGFHMIVHKDTGS